MNVLESRDLGGARRVASQPVSKITIDLEPCTAGDLCDPYFLQNIILYYIILGIRIAQIASPTGMT